MKPQTLRVAAVQMACSADPDTNLRHIDEQLEKAASAGVQLVLLQELHNHRYFCQSENPENFDLAETIPGPTTEHLSEQARRHELVIVASLFERRASGLYHNTAVVLDSDGSLAGKYRKMHVPDDPGYHEKFYFTPGDLGFLPITTRAGKLGVLICWDQWYPEAARLMALAGAELLLYPTAIGWDDEDNETEQQRQLEAWMTVQRAHAVSNGLPVIACNRSGYEADPEGGSNGIRFWGSSFIAGPQGELLARAPAQENILLIADIDLARNEQVRRIWPFLRDRRIDAYDDLTRRFRD
ncbi:N-carbamoylputrescine amidase [Thiogranum longum]|uniref:N-carbamoylputrescine amidase n=1 Tax=Thiogranum longum TaxID=1537524 RepID=A0A4R1H942_9GAMM|nr:carbon-nitrogen hydrolase [Thiogranum longum]TCK18377.1 N-carbamoylputrescine amidase [Thiogranum longum]